MATRAFLARLMRAASAALMLICALSAVPAAQAAPRPTAAALAPLPPPGADAERVLASARHDLDSVTRGVQRPMGDADLESRLADLPPIQAHLAELLADLSPRLSDLQARQAQMGPPPRPGAPGDDPRTAHARREIARALAEASAQAEAARTLSSEADRAAATLSDRLRENFTARLWSRSVSVLDPALWRDAALALPADLAGLGRRVSDQAAQIAAERTAAAFELGLVLGALLLGAVLIGPTRVLLNRLGYRRAAARPAARLTRILLALWLVACATAMPALAGLVLRLALFGSHLLTAEADRLLDLGVGALVFAAFIAGLGRATLSPGRPQWRLAPIPETMVRRLAPFPMPVGAVVALAGMIPGVTSLLGSSQPTRTALDCLAILAQLAVVAAALVAVGRARVEHLAIDSPNAPDQAAAEEVSRLPWILAILAAWGALAATAAALLAGYLAFAAFLMRETVWIACILGLLFLLLRLADDLFVWLMSPQGLLGSVLARAVGLSEKTLDQTGVLLSGLARLVLLLLAWAAAIAPLGARPEDIWRRFTATDFVVRLGLVSISPGAVIGSLLILLVGVAITRSVRRWLERRYLPKTDLDVGLRTSLAAGVSYLGFLVAVLLAFAYLGLSVSQIALFASALSVGIGFGLQATIGNFVAGLILLAERPVKVGDWIALGDQEGDVKKISMRATEVEMWDRSRLIVPNSELVSKSVRNVTHAGALGRVRIILRLDPQADPGQARDVIAPLLAAHAEVLAEPKPAVYVSDAKDGSVEITAIAFVASPRDAFRVKSDLLYAILPSLKAGGVALWDAAGGRR